MQRLGVGVVGCGEAAQVMHLPSLRLLASRFRVTALADISRSVAERVGAQWGVPPASCSDDWRAVMDDADVDVVLVSCPPASHAEVALAALAAGKHVLIEKPMCLTEADADALVSAQRATGLVAQVGYMRRYPAAFREACRLVADMQEIRLARVRNVLGLNELVADQVANVVRPDDLSAELAGEGSARQAAMLARELGAGADAEALHTYFFLLSLCTHDFSAMRDLLGHPDRLLYATRRNGRVSPFLTMAFDYGSFVCHYEAGFDELPRVEQDIQVYGNDRVVHVAYGNAFLRNTPVSLTVESSLRGSGTATTRTVPSWEDPFVSEWRALHESVVGRAPVRASLDDARLDVVLCRAIVDRITSTRTASHAL